jgi:trehalose 6-phosphate phosphatase
VRLEPNATAARVAPEFERWEPQVKEFVRARDTPDLRVLRVRIEDKGPIMTFHWRGAPDEEAARGRVEELAAEAGEAGLWVHWGRKVLEIRPPVPVHKGQAVRELMIESARAALYAGDDMTDLDGFAALTELVAEGRLEHAVRVGVLSDEGPPEIAREADIAVDGVEGMKRVLAELDQG